jgi:DNA-binding ferritin-like protein
MEVGTSGGPDKNQVYELSNTKAENVRAVGSVSTVGSSQSVSSTQSKEFAALQQYTAHLTEKYEQLSTNYEQHMAHLTEKYEQLSTNY